jgi:ribonuclease VapC
MIVDASAVLAIVFREPGARVRKLERILEALAIAVPKVTLKQAHIACDAYRLYGKGNHSARLNMGDCFADAQAKASGEPLLFKGGDFRLTDVEAAL